MIGVDLDDEQLIADWLLATLTPGIQVVARELPGNLVYSLPLYLVEAIAGDDVSGVIDRPTYDIGAYAGSQAAAGNLARGVRALMLFTLPGRILPGGLHIRSVTTFARPVYVPFDNELVHRYVSSYQLHLGV